MRVNTINKFDKYYKEFFESVYLFNEIAGNKSDDESLIPLYKNLLIEEAKEMGDSTCAEDEIDSIIDQFVVAGFLGKLIDYPLGKNAEGYYVDSCYKISSIMVVRKLDHDKLEDALEWVEDSMVAYLTLDIDHKGALMHIAESNLSKFIKVEGSLSEDEIKTFDKVCVDIELAGRYTGVNWNKIGDYVVFRDGNGKLMKSPLTYFEPNLTPFIYGRNDK
jgi:hypothetical protein